MGSARQRMADVLVLASTAALVASGLAAWFEVTALFAPDRVDTVRTLGSADGFDVGFPWFWAPVVCAAAASVLVLGRWLRRRPAAPIEARATVLYGLVAVVVLATKVAVGGEDEFAVPRAAERLDDFRIHVETAGGPFIALAGAAGLILAGALAWRAGVASPAPADPADYRDRRTATG